ncbi:MAG: hypothetical protein MJ172_01850 [Clostridia bacterium]|nr:hypothetical protein [Clostridia bacterium]
MRYSELNNTINELKRILKDELHSNLNLSSDVSDYRTLHNREVRHLWKKINMALNEYYNLYKSDFDHMIVNYSETEKNHNAANETHDGTMIQCFRYFNIVFYKNLMVTVNNRSFSPDFTIFLPSINKYFFIKYVDDNIASYLPAHLLSNPYDDSSIFIHCTNKALMIYEFEIQLLNHITVLLDSKYNLLKGLK